MLLAALLGFPLILSLILCLTIVLLELKGEIRKALRYFAYLLTMSAMFTYLFMIYVAIRALNEPTELWLVLIGLTALTLIFAYILRYLIIKLSRELSFARNTRINIEMETVPLPMKNK